MSIMPKLPPRDRGAMSDTDFSNQQVVYGIPRSLYCRSSSACLEIRSLSSMGGSTLAITVILQNITRPPENIS